MKSFQAKITCWIAAGLFAFMFVIMVAFNAYAIHEVAHIAKTRMKVISRSILRELADQGVPTGGPIPTDVTDLITERLAFVSETNVLAYAVVSRDHRILYSTPGFNLPRDPRFLAKEHKRIFLHSVGSGEHVDELFSEWHFMFRYAGDDFVVFTSDAGNYELFERMIQGTGIVLALALLLAVPCGYALSRRILRPLAAIGEATERVRAGNLTARIPSPNSHDEIERLVDDLNATFAELEESLTRSSQFSADAAHELKTPLTALRGNLEVCLGRERTPEEYQMVLAEAIEEVVSLSGLVKDLLLMATPGEPGRQRQFTTFDFAAEAADIVEHLAHFAEEKRVCVETELPAEVPIHGDQALLPRVCYNLCHNAIRFSPPGSTVTVSLRVTGDDIVLAVADQGLGIEPEEQERIFERFYQVDGSRSTGSGLGLAIAAWVVELHGGRIDVVSEPNQGSTFTVRLPMGQAPSPDRT